MKKKHSDSESKLFVIKAAANREPYSEAKLERSLLRSGASATLVRKVLKQIRQHLKPDISTLEIYEKAFAILKAESNATAARYGLRRAITRLGPTGFPFERLVAAMLDAEGYDTSVGVILKGRCVTHEVDVVATRGGEKVLIECKFHNQSGRKCDVKVPLYVHSRSLDLNARRDGAGIHEFWLVTNTKFSSDAIQYGNCVGLKLLSWDYPKKNSLKDRIERDGLHPITCLTTLKSSQVEALLSKGILLCSDLLQNTESLSSIGIRPSEQHRILDEILGLLPTNAPAGIGDGDLADD